MEIICPAPSEAAISTQKKDCPGGEKNNQAIVRRIHLHQHRFTFSDLRAKERTTYFYEVITSCSYMFLQDTFLFFIRDECSS
jgi:hypothetical protein